MEPRRWKRRGSGRATFVRSPHAIWFYPATKLPPVSSAACEPVWRPSTKWCFDNDLAATANAGVGFSCAATAIADNAIAASTADGSLDSGNDASPIAGISRVRRGERITATDNENTAGAGA